ncbi:hypothetical protein JX266_005992 [Neoarthrinium moseri]|nr:hypothetical protein JX266_005992 [Neoarthrinium moseri]
MSGVSLQQILDQLKAGPVTKNKYSVTGLALAGGIPLLSYAISSYRGWRALGRGGLPPNIFGWLINVALRPLSRSDTRAPAPYTLESLEAVWGPAGRQSFVEGKLPPARSGARPEVPTYVAPQRQTTEQGAPAMLERMERYLAALTAANPSLFQSRPSGLEGPYHDAVWLADGVAVPAFLKGTKGEIMHPHDDGSTHAVLSLWDASRAIELGWAERHKLSGAVGGAIPWGYVFIYAPRNEDEFDSWKSFILAAARFNAASVGSTTVQAPDL